MTEDVELVAIFKALADSSRLKIVGLLAQRPYTVEQLSAIVALKPSTISHHLSKLAEVGLVSAKAEGYYNIYQLEKNILTETMQRVFSAEQIAAVAADVDLNAFERKTVNDYSLPNGRLKTIPAQCKKLEVVLQHIVRAFERDVFYSEKQVNEILLRFHDDTASLRRELIGARLMAREADGSRYWRL